jgi:hypothetical protein
MLSWFRTKNWLIAISYAHVRATASLGSEERHVLAVCSHAVLSECAGSNSHVLPSLVSGGCLGPAETSVVVPCI